MSLINTQVVPFKVQAYHNGKFVEVTDADLRGHWSVFVFYPADFTFVCPTELEDLADLYDEFKKINCEIYSVSTDTHFTHKAWAEASPAIKKVRYPMLGDPAQKLARAFDVLIDEEGLALRGTFIINPEGVIKTLEVHHNAIAPDVTETARKLKAAQYVASHPNEVCPAKWKEGEATLAPSIDLVGKI